MPKTLTQAQIQKYNSDGFVYPIDVMTREQAESYLHRLGQLSQAEVSSEKHMLSLGQTVNVSLSKDQQVPV